VHLPVNPVAFERPCIPARVVACLSRTFQVRGAPHALRTAPPRSELGFNLGCSDVLAADRISGAEHV
jgi:hypothetical protein